METPILLLGFNRLDTFQQLIPRLKSVSPQRIYIACDGPRNEQEKIKTDEVRQFLVTNIDWTADVKFLFQENNLGCGKGVRAGIDWFFQNEEQGIILEDDCLVHPTFFEFAKEMLIKYRDDERVAHIGAANIYPEISKTSNSYFFSQVPHVWGWASWRRAWNRYSVDNVDDRYVDPFLKANKISTENRHYWQQVMQSVQNGVTDTWDYQWLATLWRNNSVAIIPNKNMVKNIGFGEDATHTFDENDPSAKLIANEIDFPLVHPREVKPNNKYIYKYATVHFFDLKKFIRVNLRKIIKPLYLYLKKLLKK